MQLVTLFGTTVFGICIMSLLWLLSVVCLTGFFFSFYTASQAKRFLQESETFIMAQKYITKSSTTSLPLVQACFDLVLESGQNDDLFELCFERYEEQYFNAQKRWIVLYSFMAAVAPLLGLLGTVWGLIVSFQEIGKQQSADITVIAPGVAEALMTTLMGLVVAIMAFTFFHWFNTKLEGLRAQLERIAFMTYKKFKVIGE